MGVKKFGLHPLTMDVMDWTLGLTLINLLRSCEKIKQEFKIRLGMMNPMYLTRMIKDLSTFYSESDKLL